MAANTTEGKNLNKSLINYSEEKHKQILQRRHLRGGIYRYLYRISLVVAVIALVTLLLQISNNAFGPVLSVPLTPVEEFSDVPLAELNGEELASLLVDELGTSFLNLFRDEMGRVSGADFLSVPISESLQGRALPDDIAAEADTLTYNDLNNSQLAEILNLNATPEQMRQWIRSEIVGEDVILEWGWITGVFNRSRVYRESAMELSGGIAREALSQAEDDMTPATLAAGLMEANISEADAMTIAERFFAAQDVLLNTDWDLERLRRIASVELAENRRSFTPNDVSERVAVSLEPMIQTALTEASINPEPAQTIAEEFAIEITRAGANLEELSSLDQRSLIVPLLTPAFTEVLRQGNYPDATLYNRSWLNPYFLIAQGQNSVPELASLRTAILGSIWVMVITMFTAFPLGVGAAIYLEEYATDNWLNNLIETNIRNLAGVPSIIYGLLGLAVFVRGLIQITSGAFVNPGVDQATLSGRTVLSAGLTLSLLILPVIIINSQEAIRAVSITIREGSYGLGATKWQTIWRQVLPAAVPGILTGTILAFSRAVGETAPLIVVGAASSISADPNIFSKFTVIPIQIFGWTEESRPEYQHLAAAAIIVLMLLLIVLNTAAIILRNRYSQVKQ